MIIIVRMHPARLLRACSRDAATKYPDDYADSMQATPPCLFDLTHYGCNGTPPLDEHKGQVARHARHHDVLHCLRCGTREFPGYAGESCHPLASSLVMVCHMT